MKKLNLRHSSGQVLVMVALALPVFFGFTALVVDGSTLMVHKRSSQNAADAVALALSQNIQITGGGGSCNNCQALGLDYIQRNGIAPASLSPAWHQCNDPDHANPTDQNCFAYPYYKASDPLTPRYGQVEVRLTTSVSAIFAGAIGLVGPFKVSARSVGAYATNPITSTTTVPGTTIAGSTGYVTVTGATHTTTDPGITIGGNGVGFAMSRTCAAMSYTGAGAAGTPLGSFATNGGLTFSGSSPKKVTSLLYDQTGTPACGNPNDAGTCTATAWGDPTNSNNRCVKTLIDLNASVAMPIDWPLAPPSLPTLLPTGTAFTPSTDYPSRCVNLGSGSNLNFSTTGHPPGIYCVTGSTTVLNVSGDLTTAGADGYTFFGLNGAKIAGSSLKVNFYWPSSCGTRPTTRSSSYTCFGRTITGYDRLTLLYSTSTAFDSGNCSKNAICLAGGGGVLTGDIFAPKPDVFPPTPALTDTGGGAFVAGGSMSAGSGFIESWTFSIQGNTGSYAGNGPGIVVPGATHTTTDPNTTVTNVFTGTTNPGSTNTTTVGTATTIGLDE